MGTAGAVDGVFSTFRRRRKRKLDAFLTSGKRVGFATC